MKKNKLNFIILLILVFGIFKIFYYGSSNGWFKNKTEMSNEDREEMFETLKNLNEKKN